MKQWKPRPPSPISQYEYSCTSWFKLTGERTVMSDANDNGNGGFTRRAFMTSTALAAGALALPPMALANEDEVAATSGEPGYSRAWQYKPDVVQDNVAKYNQPHSGKGDSTTPTRHHP